MKQWVVVRLQRAAVDCQHLLALLKAAACRLAVHAHCASQTAAKLHYTWFHASVAWRFGASLSMQRLVMHAGASPRTPAEVASPATTNTIKLWAESGCCRVMFDAVHAHTAKKTQASTSMRICHLQNMPHTHPRQHLARLVHSGVPTTSPCVTRYHLPLCSHPATPRTYAAVTAHSAQGPAPHVMGHVKVSHSLRTRPPAKCAETHHEP